MSSQSTSRLSILSGRCLWRRQAPNEVSDQRPAFFPKQGPLRPTNSCTSAATQDGRVLRRYRRRWKLERLFAARRIVRGCADPGIALVSTVTDHASGFGTESLVERGFDEFYIMAKRCPCTCGR